MIVKAIHRAALPLLTSPVEAPAAAHGVFGRVAVLELTASELSDSFGILLAPLDVESPEELFALLEQHGGRSTAVRVDRERLMRLLARGIVSLPCFVGYLDVAGTGLLPFLSDGPGGKWSLFLEEDGCMTLVERRRGQLCVTPDRELARPALASVTPISACRPALLGSRTSAEKVLARTTAG